MNLYKIGLFEYYLSMPVKVAGIKVKRIFRKVKRKVLRNWYCDGCKKYHGRRVIAYYVCDLCDGVCFKHITAQEILKCEGIILAGQNVTERIKKEVDKK